MTAAVGLYLRMGLPEPWSPTTTSIPLIVYGGSGAVVRNLTGILRTLIHTS